MDEAARLRDLAAQCRQMAATLHARETAETLLEMARQFEASANRIQGAGPPLTSRTRAKPRLGRHGRAAIANNSTTLPSGSASLKKLNAPSSTTLVRRLSGATARTWA